MEEQCVHCVLLSVTARRQYIHAFVSYCDKLDLCIGFVLRNSNAFKDLGIEFCNIAFS